jgi:hypothetical protein
MTFNEKVLYHQIHPAKLAADVGGSIVSTCLMWRRRFAWGHARCVRARRSSFCFGYKVRGPGAEEALALWALHAPLHGPARLGRVALLWASSGDVGWRMVPSRQARTHRGNHSSRSLGLPALA